MNLQNQKINSFSGLLLIALFSILTGMILLNTLNKDIQTDGGLSSVAAQHNTEVNTIYKNL
jgi:hypothetical protein